MNEVMSACTFVPGCAIIQPPILIPLAGNVILIGCEVLLTCSHQVLNGSRDRAGGSQKAGLQKTIWRKISHRAVAGEQSASITGY